MMNPKHERLLKLLHHFNPEMASEMEWWLDLFNDTEQLKQFLETVHIEVNNNEDPAPANIFRYRSTKNAIREIENQNVYLAPITSFKDPFDTVISFPSLLNTEGIQMDVRADSVLKIILDFVSLMVARKIAHISMRELRNIVRISCSNSPYTGISLVLRTITRVTCFSQTNESFAMWDNYTNGHKGVCLEYDCPTLFALNGHMYKVAYADEEYTYEYDENDVHKGRYVSIVGSILRKHSDYSYEKEWRYFSALPGKKTLPTTGALKKVYLGANISKKDRSKIMKACNETIEIYQMKVSPDKFKFEIEYVGKGIKQS